MSKEHTGHSKQLFQKPRRHLYTKTSPKANTKIRLIIFFTAKDGKVLYNYKKTRYGDDCGSDHELHIAKFSLKLKTIGKITRSFRYDLNQISYDCKIEVTNRFRRLDLVDRVHEELQMEVHNLVQEALTKIIPKKKKCKKTKRLSEEALQIAEERRRMKGKGERKRYTQMNAEFQRIARRDKVFLIARRDKAFLNEQ